MVQRSRADRIPVVRTAEITLALHSRPRKMAHDIKAWEEFPGSITQVLGESSAPPQRRRFPGRSENLAEIDAGGRALRTPSISIECRDEWRDPFAPPTLFAFIWGLATRSFISPI